MRNIQTDRWTNWARSISDRHDRVTARQGLLVMTLVEPIRMFRSITQRVEKFALAVFPRIRISIGPILQAMHQQQLSISLVQNSSYHVVGNRSEHRSPPVAMTFASSTSQINEIANSNSHDSNKLVQSDFDSKETRTLKDLAQTPLRRIFARFCTPSSSVVTTKLLLENETQTIAERVIHEHTRVELRKRGDMVVRKQMSADVAAETQPSEIEPQFASGRTRSQQPWPDKPPQLPQINVEQLTEQVIRKIDHRITAYRERLGRGY